MKVDIGSIIVIGIIIFLILIVIKSWKYKE